MKAKILIIDDDETICYSFSRIVKRMGHEPVTAMNMKDGLKAALSQEFDVIFLDVRLPDGNGLDMLPKLAVMPYSPEVMIITGAGNPDGAELAITSGAWDYIEKTASMKQVTLALDRALQYHRERQKTRSVSPVKPLQRDRIIGSSHENMASLDLVAQSAASDANVLITGETGTGKELFARAIHENSLRSEFDLVVVDCAALPETLVESLLFGHKKGAFTGADQDQKGLILQAHKGTLFLDEVGELPMNLQKAFLRVLQEHRVRPLGSKDEVHSDFRLVTATNRDLDKMVVDGSFRNDLLFRIRSFSIELPKLRDRGDDIKEIARYQIDKLCDRAGIDRKEVSANFFEILSTYEWPGNVRELINTMERVIAAARFESMIFPKHLPPQIRIDIARARLKSNETKSADHGRLPTLQEFRDTFYTSTEKKYLIELLETSGNNIKDACGISGLSRSRLYSLLKKHQISR